MEKERSSITWGSGLIVVVGALVLGLIIGKGVEKTGYASESYEELKIFAEVLTQVKKHYVEEVQTNDLVHGAVRGMLKTLDPHSAYMTPEMYKEMRVETKGEFEGLGIQIGIKDHHVTVIAPIEGTPAHAAGIETGDVILKVDETPTKGPDADGGGATHAGAQGDFEVTLTVRREGTSGHAELHPDPGYDQDSKRPVPAPRRSHRLRAGSRSSRNLRPRILGPGIGANCTTMDTQGLILDLRNNPGGLLSAAVGVSEQFLQPDTLVVSVKGRDGRKDEYRSSPPMGSPRISDDRLGQPGFCQCVGNRGGCHAGLGKSRHPGQDDVWEGFRSDDSPVVGRVRTSADHGEILYAQRRVDPFRWRQTGHRGGAQTGHRWMKNQKSRPLTGSGGRFFI